MSTFSMPDNSLLGNSMPSHSMPTKGRDNPTRNSFKLASSPCQSDSSAIHGSVNHAVNHVHEVSPENQRWVESLQGHMGIDAQRSAHEKLASHLSTTIQYHLISRQPDLLWLSTLASQEISNLTQDLVQSCLVKLCRDNHAKLRQFSGIGTFKGWATQIALNATRSELRKVRWDRRLPLDSIRFRPAVDTISPDKVLQQTLIRATLQSCLAQLPEDYRTVLVRCVMNSEPTGDVASDLQRTNQAVYNLLNRAKKRLGALLIQEGISAEDLAIFAR